VKIALELHGHLNVFIVDIYWRNINTNDLFDKIYSSAQINVASTLKGYGIDIDTLDEPVLKS